jgi:hypothetical protein
VYKRQSLFGVVDVEKLAEVRFLGSDDITNYNLRFGFQEGFNKAMELMKDKQFTEDDVRKAYIYGVSNCHSFGHSAIDYTDKCIQSLQQPAEIEVEVVMELHPVNHASGLELTGNEFMDFAILENYKPKHDSTGCLILKKK